MDSEELQRIERAQKLAIERAVRDALVDRTLDEHTRHLEQINGSQSAMADSLGALEKSLERLTVSSGAVADYVEGRSDRQFSKRTLWIAGGVGVATVATTIASLLITVLG